jgi:GntR family transcriptional regulator
MTPCSSSTASAARPAYAKISDELHPQIISGDLEPHAPLPPEGELCLVHGVNRMTARRAVVILESEGLVYRDGTRGTFVAEPRIELNVDSFSARPAVDKNQSVDLLETEEHPASLAQAGMFGIDPGSRVYVLRRLFRSGITPIALESTYLPAAYNPGLLEGNLLASFWNDLRLRYSIKAVRTTSNLEAIVLDRPRSQLLQTRQTATALRLSRRTYDRTGRCIEYAEQIFRADRVSLVIERTVLDVSAPNKLGQ